jgi:integrase
MQAVEPIWTAKPVTANNVRNRVEMVLDWAKLRGLRHGGNPARWKGHLETVLPHRKETVPVVHRAALPYREVGAFMVELKKLTDTSARVLEFQILTAARSGEVVGARWDEIDMAASVWTIADDRMKRGREHRVPLSDAAISVLERQATVREGDYIFSGRVRGRPIGIDAPMKPLQKLGYKVTAHGFRLAFRDWAAEQTNLAREGAEASLAPITADATERAYRRGDFIAKRRQIMEAWARYIAAPAPKVTGEVVALARR